MQYTVKPKRFKNMKKTARITVKTAKQDRIEGLLSTCASFSSSGSIKGMRKQYYGNSALLLVCGRFVYNVTPYPVLHRYFV